MYQWSKLALIIVGFVFSFCILPIGFMFESGTVYSRDFSRRKFGKLRVGMAAQEVERIIGPPLKKVPWPKTSTDASVEEMWAYTWQVDPTDSYYRKWVFYGNGRIKEIVNDIWID
jgi:hypothetical protein